MPYRSRWEYVSAGESIFDNALESLDHGLDEGQRARLELNLRTPVGDDALASLRGEMQRQGVEQPTVENLGDVVAVGYVKGFPWLAVIVAIILAVLVLAVLIVGWRFFKEIIEFIPDPLKGVAGAGLAVIIAVAAYAAVKSQFGAKT